MATYLVGLNEFFKAVSWLDSREKKAAFWWFEDEKTIMELVLTNPEGVYSGVTYRCELTSDEIKQVIMETTPNLSPEDVIIYEQVFENVYLSKLIRVIGRRS